MPKINKIQNLIISHLLKHGQIEILLPDNVSLQIGVLQEGPKGKKIKADDYCYVIASKENRKTLLDSSYNIGIEYEDDPKTVIYQDKTLGESGESICRLDVVH